MAKIKEIVKARIILKYLYNTPTLSCLAYLYRIVSRKGKESKGDTKYKSKNLVPGYKILVYIIVSPLPGFNAQIASLLTKN